MPECAKLAAVLREKGFDIPEGVYLIEEVKAAIEQILQKGGSHA